MLGAPAITTISTTACGTQQMVACGLQAANTAGEMSGAVTRPMKKRRLVQKRREAELFGVGERVEDLGVGADGERKKRRAKEIKADQREETQTQKLKRKFGHRYPVAISQHASVRRG